MSNFSNHAWAWLFCGSNGEWIGGLHSVSDSLLELYLWKEVSVFVPVCDCGCPAIVCVQLCVKLASPSRVMNQIKHTHTETHCQRWAGGPWSDVTSILTTTSAVALKHIAFLQLVFGSCPSWDSARTQVTVLRSSNSSTYLQTQRNLPLCWVATKFGILQMGCRSLREDYGQHRYHRGQFESVNLW